MATKTRTKTKAPTVSVTVAMFDERPPQPSYRPLVEGVAIGEWSPLSGEQYRPAGMTPLLDATAKFIAHLEAQRAPGGVTIGLLADESGSMQGNEGAVVAGINEFVAGMADVSRVDVEAAGKVLAVILTDGYENASREVTSEQLAQTIAAREAAGWTFIYLGANQDAWATGTSYGLSGTARGQTATFSSTPRGTAAAMDYAEVSAAAYLTDNKAYMRSAASAPNVNVAEDGTTTSAAAAPAPSPYNVAEALSQAKGETES